MAGREGPISVGGSPLERSYRLTSKFGRQNVGRVSRGSASPPPICFDLEQPNSRGDACFLGQIRPYPKGRHHPQIGPHTYAHTVSQTATKFSIVIKLDKRKIYRVDRAPWPGQ